MATNLRQIEASRRFAEYLDGIGNENSQTPVVLEVYGFPKDATESEIMARLFKMYQELTRLN